MFQYCFYSVFCERWAVLGHILKVALTAGGVWAHSMACRWNWTSWTMLYLNQLIAHNINCIFLLRGLGLLRLPFMVKLFTTEHMCLHINHHCILFLNCFKCMEIIRLFRLFHSFCNNCITLEQKCLLACPFHSNHPSFNIQMHSGLLGLKNGWDYNNSPVSSWLCIGYSGKYVFGKGTAMWGQRV